MKFYVVRHCSTEYSERKIHCGSTDAPLSEEGLKEREALFQVAKELSIEAVFSSPLLRARQTAEALVCERNIPLLLDARLAERRFGDFEGTDCARPDGKICRYNFAVKYPNGESNLQVAARVYAFLDEVQKNYAGRDIAIVSHGSACRIIRTYFLELTDEEFYHYSQPNGSMEVYEI